MRYVRLMPKCAPVMIAKIEEARKNGDSLGSHLAVCR